jgi:apolipoprotein N-acyltransferase
LPTRSVRYLLASLSGVLLALSFPKFGHPAFGWIALAPLLLALSNRQSRIPHPFLLGLLSGVVYFTGTLYWITRVMVVYGGLQPWVAVLVNAALVAYLALFPAVFAMIVSRLTLTFDQWGLIAAPFVWVATELGRAHLFTGFPWVLLGYSQAAVAPIAQVASLFGVYGVSALAASTSAAAVVLAVHRTARPAIVVGAILLAAAVWGSLRVRSGDLVREGDAVRVGLLQGNIEQAEKTEAARAEQIFSSYIAMTRQAIGHGAQLVVWPESSTPFMFEEDAAEAARVRAIARQARVPILLGSDQLERGRPDKYYNSAFLVRSDGTTAGVYRKMHLVPFGEYVPLRRLLFFAAPLVEAVGAGFFAGDRPELLPVDGHLVSAAICYEIVYPDLVRQFVRGGSELLTTITNDAWFGRTSAPYQHFAQASMRAVEEGRYLVRSANTGISGIVDPYGRVVEASALYEPAVIVGEARYLKATTFYQQYGDAFAYACGVLTIAMLLAARKRSQTRTPANTPPREPRRTGL